MRSIAILVIIATLIAALMACSAQSSEPGPTAATIATKVAEAPTETPRPTEPPPTRPKPIENIIPLATQAATLPTQIPTIPLPTRPNTHAPQSSTVTPPAADPAADPSTPSTTTSAPPDAQFNDEVLLQHLYDNLDLDRFALPENYEIPPDYEGEADKNWSPLHPITQEIPYYDVKDHPYLHIFSGLHTAVKEHAEGTSAPHDYLKYRYRYIDRKGDLHQRDRSYNPPMGVSHFLHYPWFEPFQGKLYFGEPNDPQGPLPKYPPIPYYFGNNSTRGVLADAVTDLFEQAIQPGVRPHAIHYPRSPHPGHETSDLGGYLRTPMPPQDKANGIPRRYIPYPFSHIMPRTNWDILHPELPIVQVTSYATTVLPLTQEPPPLSQMTPEQIIERFNRYPKAEEILEPIKITLWTLANPAMVEREGHQPIQFANRQERLEARMVVETWKEHNREVIPTLAHLPENVRRKYLRDVDPDDLENLIAYPHTLTHYAVSFVVSFQHRWQSFTDPNRWLLRFQDDLMPHKNINPYYEFSPRTGSIDPEIHDLFPYYWHTTDYMQHRIIGPVILNIYSSDVLEPGVYAMKPRIDRWEAPGPILTDDRQLFDAGLIRRKNFPDQNRPLITQPLYITDKVLDRFLTKSQRSQIERTKDDNAVIKDLDTATWGRLAIRPIPWSPNPGHPLPGHITADPYSAPGAPGWDRYNLDFHEW